MAGDVGLTYEGQAGLCDASITHLHTLFGRAIYRARDVGFERNAVQRLGAHEPYERPHTRHGRDAQRDEAARHAQSGEGVVVGKEVATSCQNARDADAGDDKEFYQKQDDGRYEQHGDDGNVHMLSV